LCGVLRFDPEPFSEGTVSHPLAAKELQGGMLVASAYALVGRHCREPARGVENDARGIVIGSKVWGRQLKEFDCRDDLVDSGPLLFTHSHAAHQSCQRLVSRSGCRVNESLRIDQRNSWISDLKTILEKFNERPSASDRHVLMDERIRDQLANRDWKEQRCFSSKRLINMLVSWK
jgi:hypothetical protein